MTEVNLIDPYEDAFHENHNNQTQNTSDKKSTKKRKKSGKIPNNNEKETPKSDVNEFSDVNESKKLKGLLNPDEDDVSQMGSDDTQIPNLDDNDDKNSVIQKKFDMDDENEEIFADSRSRVQSPLIPELPRDEKVEHYLANYVNVKLENDPLIDADEISVEKPSVTMTEAADTFKTSTKPTYLPDNSRVTYYMRFRDQIAQQQRLTDYSLIHRGKHPVLVNVHERKLKYDKFLQNIPNASLREVLKKETAEAMLNLPVTLKIPKQSLPTAGGSTEMTEADRLAKEKQAEEQRLQLEAENARLAGLKQ